MRWRPLLLAMVTAGLAAMAPAVDSGDPTFDPATLMRLVLVPADAAVGSVVYRVRAHDPDFDYPLQFDMIGEAGRSDVSVETLPCTRYNHLCQANVVLQKRLEPGRYVDFRVSVRNTKGRTNQIACTIQATNATTPRDTIFPHIPALIMVPEDAKRGTELDYIVARKNPLQPKPVYLELWGSPLFAIRQKIVSPDNTEGTIFLIGPLDFETQSMYHLTVLANDAYAEPKRDSRNIAGIEVVVVVQDVQDMPPVFTNAPPVTHLPASLVPGDIVVRVHAEDGDKGAPRQIRYGLVSEGNPFTPFFDIDETTGDLSLVRPLEEIAAISHVGAPVLLTVIAEEVRLSRDEPEAMSATVRLAFILPERGNSPPYFENDNYITRVDENSPQGTALVFTAPYVPQVSDDDAGKNGVFSLSLSGNNGTFEISPTVGERRVDFIIKVRDNTMLDYEARRSVNFQIIAQELGPATNLSATVNVTVYLNDVNDSPPFFLEESYEVELAENATAGTRLVQVRAEDVDTGVFGKVQYTAVLGYLNTSLRLDPKTGVITVAKNNHGFDREMMPDIRFLIEARDNDGVGNRATVPLVIKLLDVNDETPEFERPVYEFILSPNLRNFTSPAIVRAVDKDAEPPNNIVRYEIILGNYENKFALNEVTGELVLLEPLKRSSSAQLKRDKRQFETAAEQESEVYVLTVRAYDLGVPHRYSMATVKVYPPESKTRTMLFVVPGIKPDKRKTEEILGTITGGKVTILEIRPYKGTEVGVTDVTSGNGVKERSVVVASVLSTGNSLVDVSHIQQQLSNNKTVGTSSASVSTDNASVTIYKAENKLLFWLLIFLAICIALALIILICCCICDGCPLYMPPRKRVIRVNSTDDDVHLVVREKGRDRENKSVQAAEWYGRKEAWSAGQSDPRTKPTQWRFNRRNNRSKDISELAIHSERAKGGGEIFAPNAAAMDIKMDEKHLRKSRDGPNVIFTKDMQNGHERYIERNIYVDDIDQEYSRITTNRSSNKMMHSQNQDDLDADSIQRHELERGSDVDYLKLDSDRMSNAKSGSRHNLQADEIANRGPYSVNQGRDQMFIKEGNTEILRLVTRDGNEEERYVNLPVSQRVRSVTMVPEQYVVLDSGKDIIMKRFIADQSDEVKNLRSKLEHSKNVQNSKYSEQYEDRNYRHVNQNDYQNMEFPVPGSAMPMQIETQESNNQHNSFHTSHTSSKVHRDLLETSLRQQNELLRQILLEKGKLNQYHDASSQFEIRLETQSLPGHSVIATQTDCHISTQTEPLHMRPERRKARSDIDESYSEEEYEMLDERSPKEIRWVKRKKPRRRKSKYRDENPRRKMRVQDVKRKIRTPILEENEVVDLDREKSAHKSRANSGDVKSSNEKKLLKQLKHQKLKDDRPVRSALKKDVLLEISNSLDKEDLKEQESRPKLKRQAASTKYNDSEDSLSDENNENCNKNCRRNSNDFTDDSLERERKGEGHKKTSKNSIFSRQGSSADAQDETIQNKYAQNHVEMKKADILNESESDNDKNTKQINITKVSRDSSNPLNSNEKTEMQVSYNYNNKSSVKTKPNDGEQKKSSDKSVDLSKSVPRYMQWYNNKSNGSKVAPAKPKRNMIPKTTNQKPPTTTEVPPDMKIEEMSKKQAENRKDNRKSKVEAKEKEAKVPPGRLMKEEKVKPIPEGPLPDSHPLLQHSEHRYEHEYQNQNPMCFVQPTHLPQYLSMQPNSLIQTISPQPLYINQIPINTSIPVVTSQNGLPTTVYLNSSTVADQPPVLHGKNIDDLSISEGVSVRHTRAIEDDDSGIAMTSLLREGQGSNQNIKRLPITEKQSVFTIAYNDVQTRQLRPDSSTPSY